MKKILTIIAILACLALGALSAQAETSKQTALDIASNSLGEAREWKFYDVISSLMAQKGKVVVLNFWATWCGPCRQEIPELIDLRNAYSHEDVVVLGLSVDDDISPVPAFLASMQPNYPMGWVDANTAVSFVSETIPKTAIYGPDGMLAFESEGYMDRQQLSEVIDQLLEK